MLHSEIIDEIRSIKEEERKTDRSKTVYKGSNKIYDFRKFKTISFFGNEIRINTINVSMENDKQNHLPKNIENLKVRQDRKILSQKK